LTFEYRHIPVMLEQSRAALALTNGNTFCDCTLGGAGHSLQIANDISPDGLLIGIDQDDSAIQTAARRISQTHPQLHHEILKGNFAQLDSLLLQLQIPGIDGFLFDLGVSSPQIDTPSRGFSYAHDAPLDMRMDPGTQTQTAAEIINTLNQADLTRIFRTYGEERWAMQIARRIITAREQATITTTQQLVRIIESAIPSKARRQGGNPSKRTFQALRIYVNQELEALKTGLEAAIRWLNPGGRIVVISYHSLEDRIVKQLFAELAQTCTCPPELPICTCNTKPVLQKISSKPLVPTSEQITNNPRSKSAKLRWAIKHTVIPK
jgi:16S rRNA (cytosine1402-N4)-methyltransferase